MSTRYDDKGKFFTDVISKTAIGVWIQTATHRIHGEIYVRPGERIKDEVNRAEQFLAVTNGTIYEASGAEMFHFNFLTLNRDQIIWILPVDEMIELP